MQVTVTVEELFDTGVWEATCRLLGLNVWAVNEGQMSHDDTVEMAVEDAIALGLVSLPE